MQAKEAQEKEIDKATSNRDEKFLSGLADKLGYAARSSTIFGDPIEQAGVTVVPVGKARWCFGAGAGLKEDQKGVGGGAAVEVHPIGYIELRNGESRFRRIHNVSLPLMLLLGFGGLLLLRVVGGRH